MDLLKGIEPKKFLQPRRRKKRNKYSKKVKYSFIDKNTRSVITKRSYFTNDVINASEQRFNANILDFFFYKHPAVSSLLIGKKITKIETSDRTIELHFDNDFSIVVYLKIDLSRRIVVFDNDENVIESKVLLYSSTEEYDDDLWDIIA